MAYRKKRYSKKKKAGKSARKVARKVYRKAKKMPKNKLAKLYAAKVGKSRFKRIAYKKRKK